MKNQNEKTVFQGLMKLMKESIDAFSARGRAKGKVSDEELSKLNAVAQEKRKVFDARLNATIGDMTKDEGKAVAKNWGFFVQKCFVTGLVNANAFRYMDPRTADSIRLIAEAYVQGHNALGKKVVYGVNPRSVQELDAELVKALAVAESGTDPDKIQELRIAQKDLRDHASHLLKMKVEKSDGMNMKRSSAVQHKQAQLGTGRVKQSGSRVENTSVTLGETLDVKPLPKAKGPQFTAPRKGGEQKQ